MIARIKLIIIAVLVTALTTCLFLMSNMSDTLDRRKERIMFLEELVKEQNSSFNKLQDSCFLSQSISEKSNEMAEQQQTKATILKKELEKIQEMQRNPQFSERGDAEIGLNTSGEVGVAKHNSGGKHGTEARNIARLDSKLDADVSRLLDSTFCEVTGDSVHCSSK